MTSGQIKTLAIDSSRVYYNYLSETGRGIEEVKVLSISHNKKDLFKLKLDKKLFNLDSIEFVVAGQKILTDRIKVIVYDNDTNTLLIKPQPALQDQFKNLLANELQIISDLKFLVKRVENWYEANGEKVALPTLRSSLNPPEKNDFFSDTLPSPDQELAVKTIFTEPLSYIWGAPGTGKTQLVLAYSLIHYIRAGKKVAIFAATNNALEQVLHGVLHMTRRAGIADNKIFRLGTPSSKFAQAYPDSCESTGVQQKAVEIDNQIGILKGVIEVRKAAHTTDTITQKSRDVFVQLKSLEQSREEMLSTIRSYEKHIKDEQMALDRISVHISNLEQGVKRKERIVSSLFYALKKKMVKNTHIEIELDNEKMELQAKLRQYKAQESNVQELEEKLKDLKSLYSDVSKIENLIRDLKRICEDDVNSKNIVSKTTLQNYGGIRNELTEYLEKRNSDMESARVLASEYEKWTENELLIKLASWEAQKTHFETETEERIKDANVIALTLDCYIGRYKDKELPSEHYFLDEAGYACLIKTLTLFRKNVPITFLGDHMQLPPVCEFDDRGMNDNDTNRSVFMWAQSALYAEWVFIKSRDDAFQDYYSNAPYSFQKTKRVDLRNTYRFGSALAQKLDEYVYKNGFSAHAQNGETEIYYIHAPTNQPRPTLEGDENHRRQNVYEAAQILKCLPNLDQDIAILTPYTKQRSLLRKNLSRDSRDQVLTVHGSQGKEWNDVVLSVVDTDRMWFVDTLNKSSRGMNVLNTAVSRAKKRLFIVCDYNFWIRQDQQLLKGLLDVAKRSEI